eukprot:2744391-Amphidinium_carterae.1
MLRLQAEIAGACANVTIHTCRTFGPSSAIDCVRDMALSKDALLGKLQEWGIEHETIGSAIVM